MSRTIPNELPFYQDDFFNRPVFETRPALAELDFEMFRSRIKRAMSATLRDGGFDRHRVAQEMAAMLGSDSLSKGTLDAYTSEAKDHDISLVRFKAFIRATSATTLWDMAVSEEGLIVLEQNEAQLAEIGLIQQKQRQLSAELKRLRAKPPVTIRRGL